MLLQLRAIVGSLALLASSGPSAQVAVVPAASLENISDCALQGSEVFVSTGQGAELRRYKYPWDPAIDALCNARGFAIAAPPKSVPEVVKPPLPTPAAPASNLAARSASASDFPADSVAIKGDEVKRALSDKRFTVELADRSSWKLEYKANGYFFVNTSAGFNGSGTWKIQDDKVCTDGKGMNASCGVVYQRGDSLFMKRSATGEIIELRPR